jgi:DNA repair exonuclease SbcCD nuclease subunit
MSKPTAVLISDTHYTVASLEVADTAYTAAIDEAARLKVPLIDAGDLTNDKAILRGEVVNRLIKRMKYAMLKDVPVYLIVGNHSLINEKGAEHTLGFLSPYANVIDAPFRVKNMVLIPYMSQPPTSFEFAKGTILIMHQGFLGAKMGEYIQDKSSISPELVKDYTVLSGHYHTHQTIGTVTYVGTPYTTSFAEANDPPKGILILNEDGTYTRKILNLRKHAVINLTLDAPYDLPQINQDDLVWVKLHGAASELQKINKKELGTKLGLKDYRLELIPTKVDSEPQNRHNQNMSPQALLDDLIDKMAEKDEFKAAIKSLWREIA